MIDRRALLQERLRDAMSEYSRLMDEAEEHAAAFRLKSSLAEKVADEIKELEDELLRMD